MGLGSWIGCGSKKNGSLNSQLAADAGDAVNIIANANNGQSKCFMK